MRNFLFKEAALMNTRRSYRKQRAPAFRFSDRPIVAGLGAAVSIFVACLWIGHSTYLDGERIWPSRQRGAVSLGTVREQATQAERAAPAEPIDTPSDTPIDIPTPQSTAPVVMRPRSTIAHPPAKKPPRLVDETKTAPKHAAATLPAATPEIPHSEPHSIETMTPEVPSARTSAVNIDADSVPPVVDITPRPKTRKEVQDELRKARANGSLPRFGNPDPYGPGGSPSLSND